MTIRIGALMRVYARQVEQLPSCQTFAHYVDQLEHASVVPCYFSVWQDESQPDSDSGHTVPLLTQYFAGNSNVRVIPSKGDLFVDAINNCLGSMRTEGLTHVLVLSMAAVPMITAGAVHAVHDAIKHDGAQVVAFVHPEFPDLVRRGYVTNTHAIWDIAALESLGGFDEVDRRPPDFNVAVNIEGVGEAMNAIKLTRVAGRPVLAILELRSARHEVRKDIKHAVKIVHKERRCEAMLAKFGATWGELEATVIPGYPKVIP